MVLSSAFADNFVYFQSMGNTSHATAVKEAVFKVAVARPVSLITRQDLLRLPLGKFDYFKLACLLNYRMALMTQRLMALFMIC